MSVDKHAVDKLITDNMGLVYKQLHRFNRAYDDEAFSVALEALGKAATTYDKDKNIAFSTYATVCIYNSIAHLLRESKRQSKIQIVSYDSPIFFDESEADFTDLIPDYNTPEAAFLKKELYNVLWKSFDVVFSRLSNDVAKQIIDAWRTSDFTASQKDLATLANVSQSYVSRVLSAFKHKLKIEMEKYL